jgi:hypothetical protein
MCMNRLTQSSVTPMPAIDTFPAVLPLLYCGTSGGIANAGGPPPGSGAPAPPGAPVGRSLRATAASSFTPPGAPAPAAEAGTPAKPLVTPAAVGVRARSSGVPDAPGETPPPRAAGDESPPRGAATGGGAEK